MGKMYRDKKSGYLRYKNNDEFVHRKIVEKREGRKLEPHEVVHHIDGDKDNFRKDNLRVMSRRYHNKLHRRERKKINDLQR